MKNITIDQFLQVASQAIHGVIVDSNHLVNPKINTGYGDGYHFLALSFREDHLNYKLFFYQEDNETIQFEEATNTFILIDEEGNDYRIQILTILDLSKFNF